MAIGHSKASKRIKQRTRRVSSLERPRKFIQPPRPAVNPGDFVPPTSSSFVNVSTNAEVQLACLCSKCMLVSQWLQANQPLRERHYPLRNYAIGREIKSFEHYNTGTQLEKSYLDGCHLCTIIWRSTLLSLTAVSPETTSRLTEARNMTGFKLSLRCKKPFPKKTEIRLTLVTTWKTSGEGFLGEHRPLSLSTWPPALWGPDDGKPVPFPADEVATSRLISTSSEDFLGLISRWIQECGTHERCNETTLKSASVPTRLLYIDPLGIQCDPPVITTAGMKIEDPYLTLSYCWGGIDTVQLTTDTLTKFSDGVPLASLPSTICDAISITRKLGFKWLWVDSLCIIQDDEEDWAREAVSMADVYSNSFLTLAALGASKSNIGLFGQRDPLVYTSCKLFESNEGANVYVHPREPWNLLTDSFDNAPLHQRGWVTQERVLSPRTVNFGVFMIWECRHTIRDEYQLSRRTQHLTLKGRFLPPKLAEAKLGAIDPEARKHFYIFWCELFAFYTKALLTRPSDRRVALTGAIQAIHRHTGWRSIVGLWEPFMLQELLWHVNESSHRASNEVPTWSWLSIDTVLIHSCWKYPPARELSSYEGTAKSSIAPGPSSTECISLPTILLRCCLVPLSQMPSPFSGSRVRFKPDILEYGPGIAHSFIISSIVVAPLIETPIPNSHIYGLALRKSISVPDAYERVGTIWLHISGDGREIASLFENAPRQVIKLV